MPRPIHASISLSALRHNLGRARASAPGARVWSIIKANAYGHGIERVLPALQTSDGIGLLDIEEAERVRTAGYVGPVLLLEGFFEVADLARIERLRLTSVVHSMEQIEMLERVRPGAPLALYLKVNSGLNRLGLAPEDARRAYERLRALSHVGTITLMTHFATADGPAGTDWQRERFEAAITGLPGARSLANSAAVLSHPASHGDWVRPGIMLYGASPLAELSARELGLIPVMNLSSELIAVRDLKPGDSLGYGGRFVAPRAMRVGVVACGYADGYPRIAADGTPVVVDERRTRLIGQVSMDMITVDLDEIPAAAVGSAVELWGSQVSVDEVARAAGTSGYEMLCALAARVPVSVTD